MVGSEHWVGEPGYAFQSQEPFGAFPLAPLFRVMAQTLPHGAQVEFITLLDPAVKLFCRTQGREVASPGMGTAWRTDHNGPQGRVDWLAEVAEMYSVCRCAVWFTILDESGNPLFEAEDGNDWSWIAQALPADVRTQLMCAAGAKGAPVPAESITKL